MNKPTYSGYFRSHKWKILLIVTLTVLSEAGNFMDTLLLSNVIDRVSSANFTNIWWFATALLVMEVVSKIAGFISEKTTLSVKSSILKKLHWDLGSALAKSTTETVSQHDPAEITEKLSEGKNYVEAIYSIYKESFTLLVGIAAIAYTAWCAWQVAILLAIFFIIIFCTQRYFIKEMVKTQKSARSAVDTNKQLLLEIVSGFADVKTQKLISGLKPHFLSAGDEAVETSVKSEKVIQKSGIIGHILLATYKFSFLVLAVTLLIKEDIGFSQFVALFMYKGYIYQTVFAILKIAKYKAAASTSIQRMNEVLYHEKLAKEKFGTISASHFNGQVKIDGLTVQRGNDTILNNVSLEFPAKSFIGIVGCSGCGKSTLLKAIAKQVTPSHGSIIIDGVDMWDLDEMSHGKAITLAPQQPFLFSLSIRDNLMLANPKASDKQIWEALKMCKAEQFVQDKGGLDATISQKDLSGGERQRLALARIPLAGGRIILLDESTSALDAESQAAIVETIQASKGNHTIVLVAHRVSTLKKADMIVVMDKGTVSAVGTYSELLKTSELFRKMVENG